MRKQVVRSSIVLGVIIFFLISGCAGTPKVSQWNTPSGKGITFSKVFNAALAAGAENKFTVVSSDRQAGVISMRQEVYGGNKKNNERRMSIKIKQMSNGTIEVRTKVSGSDFGIIEGALGGLVHEEITNNFYVYLFRELHIDKENQRKIVVVDEN
jgi:hypothetical protein